MKIYPTKEEMKYDPLDCHINGQFPLPGQDEFGYGKNIPTSTKVFYKNRWRRVYVTIYSNAGHQYIEVLGTCITIADSCCIN